MSASCAWFDEGRRETGSSSTLAATRGESSRHHSTDLAQLRRQRHTVLDDPGASTDEKLDTLIRAAKLTAQIDALLQPS